MPTWLLLAGLIALSTLVRSVLALRDPGPWIFQDEIVYSELAKSLAYTGEPAIRGVAGSHGFGLVYPLLIAPAYLLFDAVPDAYDALRILNSLLMSLTAIPAYLLARRIAGRWLSLACAALAVAIPSMGYTGTVMTENAFYPLSVTWLLLLVIALERPTVAYQFAVLGVLAVAFFTRVQAATFVGILVLAIVLSVSLEARVDRDAFLPASARRIVAFWPTLVGLTVFALLAVVVQAVQGEPLREALGSYAGITAFEYDWREVFDWLLWHLGEIDIVVGILPFAALLLLSGFVFDRPRNFDLPLRAFIAGGLAFVAVFAVVVSAYASQPIAHRIEERNFFPVAVVFFAAFVAWIHRGALRPWPAVAWALIPAVVLPARIPFERFLNDVATHSTMGLLPVWRLQAKYFDIGTVPEAIFVAALAAAAIFVVVPRRFAWILPLVVLLYYGSTARMIENFTHKASVDAVHEGAPTGPRDWIDRAAGRDARVATLWWGGPVLPLWQLDFFNRSVGRAYVVSGNYDTLPITAVEPRPRDGLLREAGGRPVEADHVLTHGDTVITGRSAARDPATGATLYEIQRPVRAEQKVDGLYSDRWSSGGVYYVRYGCPAGTLHVDVNTAPELRQGRPVTIEAASRGGARASVVLRPGRWSRRLLLPLRPRQGICEVDFTVSPLVSALHLGTGDRRELGARFESFVTTPANPTGARDR